MAVSNDAHTDQRVLRHCDTLRKSGFDVELLGVDKGGAPTGGAAALLRTRHVRGWRYYLELNWALRREVKRRRPDLVWANDSDTLAGCWLAARRCGVPLVLDAHELFPEVPEIRHKPLVKWVWRTLERLLMPHCDALLTVCDGIADHYRQELGVQMAVVRNMADGELRAESGKWEAESGKRKVESEKRKVESEKMKMESENSQFPILNSQFSIPNSQFPILNSQFPIPHSQFPTLLYQGWVNVGRGVDWAIDALEWLDGCRLVVAGGGDLLAQMQAYAASKPWAERIVFTGPLAPEVLRRLTPTADVGLVMLEDMCLSYHYAFPNRIGDLVQAGVPMVVSDLPEMARFVRRHKVGEVMRSPGARALADSVRRVLDRGREAYRFDSARADLDWNKEKQQLINIANKLCCTTFC